MAHINYSHFRHYSPRQADDRERKGLTWRQLSHFQLCANEPLPASPSGWKRATELRDSCAPQISATWCWGCNGVLRDCPVLTKYKSSYSWHRHMSAARGDGQHSSSFFKPSWTHDWKAGISLAPTSDYFCSLQGVSLGFACSPVADFKWTSQPRMRMFSKPAVILIYIDCVSASCQVSETFAVEVSAFSQT